MMRKLVAILTFVFTFTQAFAYGPVEKTQIDFDASVMKLNKPMSEKKFKRVQKRAIRKAERQLKKVQKLSVAEQTEYALKKLEKNNKKATRSAKRISKSNRLYRKFSKAMTAKHMDITDSEIRGTLEDILSGRALAELKQLTMAKIEEAGSYANVLKAKIETIKNMKRVEKGSEKIGETLSSGGDYNGLMVLIAIIVTAFVICIIWSVVLMVKGVIAIASGAVAPGLLLFLCGAFYLADLLLFDY
jgi:hypothetical protein